MRKNMAAMLFVLFAIASCESGMNDKQAQQYNEQKEQLLSQEKIQPLNFLTIASNRKKNIFGSTVIKGVVKNTATVASYKNVRLRLLSFDKKRKMVEEHEDVISGPIRPNNSHNFTLRYKLPRSTDSVAVSIMSAAVAD